MTDKEKTIKELKEVLDNLDITNKYRLNLIRAIEYLQEEPVNEDLEEAAKEYANSLSSKCDKTYVAIDFRAGAKWQKEEIMKDAIDAEITYGKSLDIPSLGYKLDKEGLDCGDKVKVIIIKK